MDYPKRESHFAHKFVRLLQKSCAALDIGHHAALLLVYIAHTEDAARYSGPVRFWNEQLMTTMAFTSPKQLTRARDAAIAAGWLVYFRSGNRQVGQYWVTIPDQFEGLPDGVIEDNHSVEGMNNGTKVKRKAERIGNGKRNESETESGKPSNPIPEPFPKELQTEAFAALWEEWQQHRREIKKPQKPTAEGRLLKKLAAWGEVRAMAALDHTISNGWQGLREPDGATTEKPVDPTAFFDDLISGKLTYKPTGMFDDKGNLIEDQS